MPEIADEWMTLVNLATCQKTEANRCYQATPQDGAPSQRSPEDAPYQKAPNKYGPTSHRSPTATDQYGTTTFQRATTPAEAFMFMDALEDEPLGLTSPPQSSTKSQVHTD